MRYSARDVAVMRAKQLGIPILLGSATPALESYAQGLAGKYTLLRLSARPVSRLPTVRLVNTGREPLEQGLGGTALRALTDRLERGEQSLVFVNRRGYSPVLYCRACRWWPGARAAPPISWYTSGIASWPVTCAGISMRCQKVARPAVARIWLRLVKVPSG